MELHLDHQLGTPTEHTDTQRSLLLGKVECFSREAVLTPVFSRGYRGARDIVSAHTLLLGGHFSSWDDVRIEGVCCSFTSLEAWRAAESFVEHKDQAQDFPRGVSFAEQPPILLDLQESGESFQVGNGYGLSGDRFREFTLRNTCKWSLTTKAPRDLNWAFTSQRMLWELLAILVGRPVLPRSLNLYGSRRRDATALAAHFRSLGRTPPANYWTHTTWKAYRPQTLGLKVRHYLPEQMIASFNDLGDQLETFVQRWFSNGEQAGPLRQAVFSAIQDEHQLAETQFLSLVQALEGFSRRKFPRESRSKESQTTLLERLNELSSHLPQLIKDSLQPTEADFWASVVATRDQLVHQFPTVKKPGVAWEFDQMAAANFDLTAAACAFVLLDAGLDEQTISKGLRAAGWIS